MLKKFKIVIAGLAFLVPVLAASPALASDFCDGFKQGYKTGYKQAKGTSWDPLMPLCPIKPLKGFGDPESDFEFGYTVSFKKGTKKGSR